MREHVFTRKINQPDSKTSKSVLKFKILGSEKIKFAAKATAVISKEGCLWKPAPDQAIYTDRVLPP